MNMYEDWMLILVLVDRYLFPTLRLSVTLISRLAFFAVGSSRRKDSLRDKNRLVVS